MRGHTRGLSPVPAQPVPRGGSLHRSMTRLESTIQSPVPVGRIGDPGRSRRVDAPDRPARLRSSSARRPRRSGRGPRWSPGSLASGRGLAGWRLEVEQKGHVFVVARREHRPPRALELHGGACARGRAARRGRAPVAHAAAGGRGHDPRRGRAGPDLAAGSRAGDEGAAPAGAADASLAVARLDAALRRAGRLRPRRVSRRADCGRGLRECRGVALPRNAAAGRDGRRARGALRRALGPRGGGPAAPRGRGRRGQRRVRRLRRPLRAQAAGPRPDRARRRLPDQGHDRDPRRDPGARRARQPARRLSRHQPRAARGECPGARDAGAAVGAGPPVRGSASCPCATRR